MPSTASDRLTPTERRSRIEQAATRLFADRGYAATTVDDIVQAAGVTKPMLYRHFESKQELCIALLESFREDLVAAPLAQFAPGADDPRAQLSAMLEAWFGHIEAHPDAARLLFTPFSGDPQIERVQRELYVRQRATQVALLTELVPSLDRAEAEPVGEAFRSSLAGVALWWLDHPKVPREVPTSALVHLTHGTIEALKRASD